MIWLTKLYLKGITVSVVIQKRAKKPSQYWRAITARNQKNEPVYIYPNNLLDNTHFLAQSLINRLLLFDHM